MRDCGRCNCCAVTRAQDCALGAAARRQQNQRSTSGGRPSIAFFISLTVCLTRPCPRSPSANSASSLPSIWTATPFKSFLTKYFCSLHSRCPRCSAPHAARLRRPHCLPGTMVARQRHRSYSAQRRRPHQPHHAHSVEQSGVCNAPSHSRVAHARCFLSRSCPLYPRACAN